MIEEQVFLYPTRVTLTGSFTQVSFNLKRLATYYPTLSALQRQLSQPAAKANTLSILPLKE